MKVTFVARRGFALNGVGEITAAASKGKLETGLAGFVVNCPFVEVGSKMMMSDKHMVKDDPS